MDKSIVDFMNGRRKEWRDELDAFLRIPSISALSEHREDVRRAAEWLADAMRQAGLEHVEVIAGPKHPVVCGDWLHAPGRPTALIYGHYDVQPVDPLPLWQTSPFEPDERDGKLYARGASDDKGPLFLHIKALQAHLEQHGSLPVNVKFCVEGEEEIGSPHLPAFIEEHREKLQADCVVISDSPMLEKGRPSIVYALRGLCAFQIDVLGAKSDLHSGLYGGGVANPIHALAQLLATMHDGDGRIAIDGFYDRVEQLSEDERKQFMALNFNEAKLAEELGVGRLFGEKGYSYLEHTLSRPTLEVNGFWGGFQGEGTKTVLPSEAHAKITCRLVPHQKPEEILALVEKHIERHTPPGVAVKVERYPDRGYPFLSPIDHPVMRAAARAYEHGYGVAPVFTRGGGSIPIVETFSRLLNAPVVLMGFSLPEENFHAPNEFFTLENFDKGLLTLHRFWNELAELPYAPS